MLQYVQLLQILKAGQLDTRPTRGQLVTVRCSGQLDDGTAVDKHDSLELCVGEDDFIPGMFCFLCFYQEIDMSVICIDYIIYIVFIHWL